MGKQKISKGFKLKAKLNYYFSMIFSFSFGNCFKWFSFKDVLNYFQSKVDNYKSWWDRVNRYLNNLNDGDFGAFVMFVGLIFFVLSFLGLGIYYFINPIDGSFLFWDIFAMFFGAFIGGGLLAIGLVIVFCILSFLFFLVFFGYYYVSEFLAYPIAVICYFVGNLLYNVVYSLLLVLKSVGLYLFNLLALIFTPRVESCLQGVIIVLEKKRSKMNKFFTNPKGKYKAILRLRDESITLIKDFKKQGYDPKQTESMLNFDIEPAIDLMDKTKEIVKASNKVLDKLIKEFEESLRIYKLQKREQRILGNKKFIQKAVEEVFDRNFEEFAKFPKLEEQVHILRKKLATINSGSLIADSLDKAADVIRRVDDEYSELSDAVKI